MRRVLSCLFGTTLKLELTARSSLRLILSESDEVFLFYKYFDSHSGNPANKNMKFFAV